MQGDMPPETISKRATGAVFFAAFGGLWLCIGLAAEEQLDWRSGVIVVAVVAPLIIQAVRLVKVAKAQSTTPPSPEDGEVQRQFNRINTIQWVTIVASLTMLNVLQEQLYIAPVIAGIVAIHLFPLARLFGYLPHFITGGLLVLWLLVVLLFAMAEHMAALTSFGTGAILLGSAAYTLSTATRAATTARRHIDR